MAKIDDPIGQIKAGATELDFKPTIRREAMDEKIR